MDDVESLDVFSRNRLNGGPVPKDLEVLFTNREELAQWTGIELRAEEGWAPWLDTSYLNERERADPDIAANVRAIADVCGMIAFVAADDDDQYLGYWRGPDNRPVADAPLVLFDNEGRFNLCGGSNFAEAVLNRMRDEERFAELREWLVSRGIPVRVKTMKDVTYPKVDTRPDRLHDQLYRRYLEEAR
jgi:hypothetical protein